MIRPFLVLFCLLALSWSGSALGAAHPPVVLAFSESELDPAVRRVRAELESAGYGEVVLERRTPLGTCTSRPASESGPGQVGIVLRLEGKRTVTAEICAKPRANQVTVVTARGSLEEQGDFAIVVTEALHGLLTKPREREQELTSDPEAEQVDDPVEPESPAPSFAASVWGQSRAVFDLPTGEFWMGVVPGIHIPISERIEAGAELLLGFRPIEYSDESIDLKSHLVWARFGLLGSRTFGATELGWTCSGGLFSNRAKADASAPRRGGSDGVFGAVFGAGVFGEFPARGPLYVIGSLGVSTLVPRLSYQMSEDVTPELGALLLEGGLGLGVRLGKK